MLCYDVKRRIYTGSSINLPGGGQQQPPVLIRSRKFYWELALFSGIIRRSQRAAREQSLKNAAEVGDLSRSNIIDNMEGDEREEGDPPRVSRSTAKRARKVSLVDNAEASEFEDPDGDSPAEANIERPLTMGNVPESCRVPPLDPSNYRSAARYGASVRCGFILCWCAAS
ncbi:unnamed protein product [Nezara viridula]|uniref:Uncharacterized protein n=1 Tax=Nezara viridula TaxID=85310 RepID=A0A9P0E592_NEZVI|nr:unnamed protein product [Nezara viridula]